MARKIVHPLELSVIAAVVGLAVVGWIVVKFFAGPPALVETNRVKHPAGFSIIRPDDWDFYLQSGTAKSDYAAIIDLRPRAFKGQSPSIVVARMKQVPTTQELNERTYKPAEFQGQPAMISDTRHKGIRMIKILFQRDNAWYHISTQLPQWESMKEDQYLPIANSFQLSAPFADLAATTALSPVTLPSVGTPPKVGTDANPTTTPSP